MSIVCFIIRCYNSSTNTAQVYNEIPYSLVQVGQRAVWRREENLRDNFRVFWRDTTPQYSPTAKLDLENLSQCRKIRIISVRRVAVL